jgi:hypothetical protein
LAGITGCCLYRSAPPPTQRLSIILDEYNPDVIGQSSILGWRRPSPPCRFFQQLIFSAIDTGLLARCAGMRGVNCRRQMDEPAKRPDLSQEQQNTAALIQQLLGKSMAVRDVDFCRLASGALPLRVSIPVAAHALRELESILRQTLAGPMEIAVDATPDDLAKVEDARANLRTIGFSDDAINRAAKELQPRLSHKAQIQAIVTRLGLAADGDIARAWITIFASSRPGAWSRPLSVTNGRRGISGPMARPLRHRHARADDRPSGKICDPDAARRSACRHAGSRAPR